MPKLGERKPIADRFWPKVDKRGPDECWLWTATRIWSGYGQCRLDNDKKVSAHRLSWQLHNGAVPDGMSVLHRCDTRACVNPAHLFLGTGAENMTDKKLKGRCVNPSGEASPNAKLTQDQVAEIRASTDPQHAIARRFNVSQQQVSRIVRKVRWPT